ncbi:lycopene cyclase family protein [Spirosoma sp. RP8]|uniref:Lycopene cyclase family protein n=1 Tax=Spirosoma liriopis TaxID=2937440 RepID=A0ABT0HTC9_9BACT|nr:lycopene cyclase family protein [Spirosoma liriopis]MCK8495235.1 lycopene cyclase family protein [Spirosoma liriopis]
MDQSNYDYIIAGAGAAGLSLLCYLLAEENLAQKSILLIDSDLKKTNDRTWCFWQQEQGPFESCLESQWEKLMFHSPDFSEQVDIGPYKYKMLTSIAFYQHCFQLIEHHPKVVFKQDQITSIHPNGSVVGTKDSYKATYVFNSVFRNPAQSTHTHYLLQHFRGYFIETDQPTFDVEKPVLMDFRVEQDQDCRFVYVLPTSPYRALVEYTGFSTTMLESAQYDRALDGYIRTYLGLNDYRISHVESGVIPMTNAAFPVGEGAIVNIGTAGGATKASTGYTFSFIQKQCQAIARRLAFGQSPTSAERFKLNRFALYDRIFLRVLKEKKRPSWLVFNDLFKQLPAALILRFLSEETNVWEEFRLTNVMDKPTFILAALREATAH